MRHVVDDALARGWTVRAAGRRRLGKGQWEPFDWDDRSSWRPAFRGSDAAYLLIPFSHPGAPETAPDLISAVADAGVPRISLLSSMDSEHARPDSPLRVAEASLSELPVRSAILRPTWFLDNFTTGSFAAMTKAGQLRLPSGDGRVPFIDARDVVAVAAASMSDNGPHGILPLTGPEAIDHHDLAMALAEAFGCPVSYSPSTQEEFIDMMTGRGFPYDYARFLSDALLGVAAGRLSVPVSDTVERVCGRRAYSVADFARHAAEQIPALRPDGARR